MSKRKPAHRRSGDPAWIIVIERWPPMGGWNWTLYLGGTCRDEGFRRTRREALGAARGAIRALSRGRGESRP